MTPDRDVQDSERRPTPPDVDHLPRDTYRVYDTVRKISGWARDLGDGQVEVTMDDGRWRLQRVGEWRVITDRGPATPLVNRYFTAGMARGRRYALESWETIIVASLSAFLGAYAKDLASSTAKATSRGVAKGARQLRSYVQERRRRNPQGQGYGMVFVEDPETLLIIANPDGLPDEAWHQLVRLDFRSGPGYLSWNDATGRWSITPWVIE